MSVGAIWSVDPARGKWLHAKAARFRDFLPASALNLARLLYRHIADLTWPAVGLIAALHFLSSWALMALSECIDGNNGIAAADIFWYYYFVTTTTVGYGDFYPTGMVGRAVAVVWVTPGGIAIFTSVIAKVVQSVSGYWRKRMRGLGDYSDLSGHTVIFGWGGEPTQRMVAYMYGDNRAREIVLVDDILAENPMPHGVQFVRGPLTDDDTLTRAGVATAGRAVLRGRDDNATLATCLAVAAKNPNLHLAAYFSHENVANLLRSHCPTAECLVPMATELLVRTADDPGSSRVPTILLSTLVGPTLFGVTLPPHAPNIPFGSLFTALKRDWQATVLGVASGAGIDRIVLNPPDDRLVLPGETLYYMAAKRLAEDRVSWNAIGRVELAEE